MSVEVESAPVLTEKTTESKESPEAPVEAAKLLALGKRNLLCGEIPTAVNQLQEASSLLAASYGETAFECGESYFYYGQALLELARMETGVLGNALQGVPEEDTEDDAEPSEQFEKTENITGEELEKIRDDVYDAMSESDPQSQAKKEEESKTNGDVKTENEKSEDVAMETEQGNKENVEADAGEEETKEGEEEPGEGEDGEDGEEEGEGTAEEGEETDPGEGPSTGAKEEDPDDISNLQLSWEMLELAKVIYLKQEEQEMKLRAAQAFLKLGEVSLETEQYDQAISDISDCLKIQQEQLAEDDRLLAETQYQLGLAFSFNKKFDEAVDSFRAAIKVIEERIGKLKKVVEDGKTTEKTEEKTAEKKEEKVEEKKEKVEEKKEEKKEEKVEEKKEEKVEEKKEKVEEKKEENVEEKKAEEETEKPEGDKTTDKTECEQKETKDIPVDPVKAAQKEIDELSEILPDIRSKIEDVAEERKNLDVLKTVAKEMCTNQMETETETIGTQPQTNENGAKASDISHLIRKKRKPESDIEEEAETKKSKQEDGSGDAAPKTNGVHEEETTKEATVKDVPMVTEDKAEAVST